MNNTFLATKVSIMNEFKLINEDEVYNNLNSSIESLNSLISDIKANPKKYVHFSVFGRK